MVEGSSTAPPPQAKRSVRGDDPEPDGLTGEELRQRVIYSLFLPAVMLASAFEIPAKELAAWLQVAHFEHLRARGVTLTDTADALGVSVRTAKRLSRQLKLAFLRPEIEHELPVKIEFMLRAESMSAARLAQVLKEVPATEVHMALGRLLGEGRVEEVPGRTTTYRILKSVNSLVRDSWLARIGGLNSLLRNLGDTVVGRFFNHDSRALARTLSFHVLPEHYSALEALLEHTISQIAALDAEAQGQPLAERVRLSLLYAPFELAVNTRHRTGGDQGEDRDGQRG